MNESTFSLSVPQSMNSNWSEEFRCVNRALLTFHSVCCSSTLKSHFVVSMPWQDRSTIWGRKKLIGLFSQSFFGKIAHFAGDFLWSRCWHFSTCRIIVWHFFLTRTHSRILSWLGNEEERTKKSWSVIQLIDLMSMSTAAFKFRGREWTAWWKGKSAVGGAGGAHLRPYHTIKCLSIYTICAMNIHNTCRSTEWWTGRIYKVSVGGSDAL